MSDSILEDYKLYYSARLAKYANNPKFRNSYLAEKQMSDALQACSCLEDFRENALALTTACAIALVKDEFRIELNFYDNQQEIIRGRASKSILEKIDFCLTSLDLATLVLEEKNKNNVTVSLDESHRISLSEWDLIDEISIFENAVVPEKYKARMLEVAGNIKQSLTEGIHSIEKTNSSWQAGWKIIPEKNLEYRHLRILPFALVHVQAQIAVYKSLIGR
jgi:hypothetical protein